MGYFIHEVETGRGPVTISVTEKICHFDFSFVRKCYQMVVSARKSDTRWLPTGTSVWAI